MLELERLPALGPDGWPDVHHAAAVVGAVAVVDGVVGRLVGPPEEEHTVGCSWMLLSLRWL